MAPLSPTVTSLLGKRMGSLHGCLRLSSAAASLPGAPGLGCPLPLASGMQEDILLLRGSSEVPWSVALSMACPTPGLRLSPEPGTKHVGPTCSYQAKRLRCKGSLLPASAMWAWPAASAELPGDAASTGCIAIGLMPSPPTCARKPGPGQACREKIWTWVCKCIYTYTL